MGFHDERVHWKCATSRVRNSLGPRQANAVTSLPRPIASSLLESHNLRGEGTRLAFARLRYGDRPCCTIVARCYPAVCICRESQPPRFRFSESESSVVFQGQRHVISNAACKDWYAVNDQQGRPLSRYVIVAIVNGMERSIVPRYCIFHSCISCAGDILLRQVQCRRELYRVLIGNL